MNLISRRRTMGKKSEEIDWKAMYMAVIENTAVDLIIPEGVTRLMVRLSSNSNIKSIKLPSTLTYINNYIFLDITFTSPVIIPKNCTSIGQQVFNRTVPYFVIENPNPPTIFANTFYDVYLTQPYKYKFYVPDESVETYKTANVWSNIADKIFPISEIPE